MGEVFIEYLVGKRQPGLVWIKERHPEDYYLFKQYGEESVGDPDIIRLPCEACVDQDHEAMLHGLFFEDSGSDCYWPHAEVLPFNVARMESGTRSFDWEKKVKWL